MIFFIKHEMKLYFYSWLGWSIILILHLISFIGFNLGIITYGKVQPFYSFILYPLSWAVLFTSSRNLSKDRELGIFSLYLTSKTKLEYIIYAKVIALMLFFLIILLSLTIYPLLNNFVTNISWSSLLSSITASFMVIWFFTLLGLWISALSRNSLISILWSLAAWILLTIVDAGLNFLPKEIIYTQILREMSYATHYNNILNGIFSLKDIFILFMSGIIFLKLIDVRNSIY